MKRHFLILAAFAVACSTPDSNRGEKPAADGPELTRTAEDDRSTPEADDQPQPFRLSMDGDPAAWFVPHGERFPHSSEYVRVVGANCGMNVYSESDVEALVYCRGDDAPQLIRTVSGTRIVRFGPDDTLVSITADRRLLRWRPDSQEWVVENGELPASSHADAAEKLVVVSDKSSVWVSVDSGHSFEQTAPLDAVSIDGVLVRPDGLVVVDGQGEASDVAFSAMPPYNEWNKIRASKRPLSRKGAWIQRAHHRGTLASDGQTWVNTNPPDVNDWHDYLGRYRTGRSAATIGMPLWTLDRPAAPSKGSNKPRRRSMGSGGLNLRGDCTGAGCMEPYPQVFESTTSYHFVGQYLCRHESEPENPEECGADAEILFTPQQAAYDGNSNGVLGLKPVEPWMRGVTLHSHGGLGFSSHDVDGGKTQYWTTGTDLNWKKEALLEGKVDLDELIFAPDGTMLAHSDDSKSTVAWIRPPVAPGQADQWREVRVDGAAFYRPLPGGQALAVVDRSDSTEEGDAVIELVRIGANGEETIMMEGIQIAEPRSKLLLVDEDGTVFLSERVGRPDEENKVLKVLMDDGTWR